MSSRSSACRPWAAKGGIQGAVEALVSCRRRRKARNATIDKLVQTEPALDRLVRHVVETMHPLRIRLFGSRAEQRARPTSDYDLLVVMPDDTPEADLDPVRAWRLGWEVQVTADIIPYTRREFEEEREEIGSLPRAAARRGRRLYER